MSPSLPLSIAAIVVLAAPFAAFGVLALSSWANRPLREATTVRAVGLAFALSTAAIAYVAITMASAGLAEARVPLGAWFRVSHYGFGLALVLDGLSIAFAGFSAVLLGLIAAFSARYLHRERGFGRFYLLLALFGGGVELVVLAGSLDMIFFGWELVGITSALLIAFFDERRAPVRHGLRTFITYRACDVGLLAAAVWLHHTVGSAALTTGGAAWAGLPVPASLVDATLVGLLLAWAAVGKSAQVPLGGWLPRAMEGPTPSSAIFYGALSIHLGPYLLLRATPILERAPIAAGAVIAIGALTALHATFVGRVQSDIKSALAYASMTQVGLIAMEIGLGFSTLALVHIVGHAAIRSLQILRSPTLLHDHHHLEQAMGAALPRTGGHLERLVPRRLQPWLYRLALERGYFDTLLVDHLVGGFVRFFRGVDRVEERWIALLEGHPAPEAHPNEAHPRGRT